MLGSIGMSGWDVGLECWLGMSGWDVGFEFSDVKISGCGLGYAGLIGMLGCWVKMLGLGYSRLSSQATHHTRPVQKHPAELLYFQRNPAGRRFLTCAHEKCRRSDRRRKQYPAVTEKNGQNGQMSVIFGVSPARFLC